MPTYVFKGRNRMNEVVTGERVADDRESLRQLLRREQVTLTSVKEKGREIGIPKIGGRKRVRSKDLAIFTRQFSVMIDAGLPLVQCLDILGTQEEDKNFSEIIHQTRTAVEQAHRSATSGGRRSRSSATRTTRASRAPAPRASNTLAEFPSTVAVTTRIAQGLWSMMRRMASTPSIFGIIKSIKIRSGVSCADFLTASAPS